MSAYAIFQTGGKQYRVQPGDIVDVELCAAENEGKIEFGSVLFMHDGKQGKVGTSATANARVRGEIVDRVRGPKVLSCKYKKRKNYRRKVGHRQNYMRVKIVELVGA